jgi:hypothetical protein
MSTAKCNAKSTKQGTLKLFDFKPLNEEEKVAKEAILKHRKEVAIETRRQQEIQEEVDERERELRETGNSTSDNDVEVIVSSNEVVGAAKKAKSQRPHNWVDIAREYLAVSKARRLQHVISLFNLEVSLDRRISYWSMTLSRWVRDAASQKEMQYKRSSSIPIAVEKALVREVIRYNDAGVPLNNMILRMNLVRLMKEAALEALIAVPNSFGDSWFQRFYSRNNISSRVATTKMREDIPADFDAKRAKYLAILSVAIHDNNVPDALIMGVDETNVQFVPSVKRTRALKGRKRIRVIGIGKEKAQITCTFGGAVNGELLPRTQLIFGGKTVLCHPNKGRTAAPDGLYYDHTTSHWQNHETYLSYMKEVIVPYRLATIKRLGLSVDQKIILIHDLHYSHKGDAVRDYCTANNIIMVFVPAGCTDIIQMCDVALNKTFKNAVSLAFVSYVNNKFIEHTDCNPNDIFKLNMALSIMKPLLPGFVQSGIAAMSTTAMKAVIRNCFLTNGLVKEARTPAALQSARALLAVDNTPTVGEEVECDLGAVDEDSADGEQEFVVEIGEGGDNVPVDTESAAIPDTHAVIPDTHATIPDTHANSAIPDTNTAADGAIPDTHADADAAIPDTHATIPDTNTAATVGPYIVISGGTANNVTYNVNIASTIKPSYDYEPVLNDWQDNAKFSKNNIVTGKRKRVSKFL